MGQPYLDFQWCEVQPLAPPRYRDLHKGICLTMILVGVAIKVSLTHDS